METQERKWPCIKCTAQEFKEQICDKMRELGYIITDIHDDFYTYCIIVVYFDGDCRKVTNLRFWASENVIRHLCKTIPEFLEAAKNVAIREGWLKETTTEESDYIIKELGVDSMGRTIGFSKIKTGGTRTNSEEPAGKSDVIDWEKRRYEIARACLEGYNGNSVFEAWGNTHEEKARWAVADADALIKELKNKRDED